VGLFDNNVDTPSVIRRQVPAFAELLL
jgi:hypothetical protein